METHTQTDRDERAMKGWKPKRQHRRHTYYKVQVYDSVSLTWLDEPPAFDELSAANNYIMQVLVGKQSRIIVVEGARRFPLNS
jgi:hypothetical protein